MFPYSLSALLPPCLFVIVASIALILTSPIYLLPLPITDHTLISLTDCLFSVLCHSLPSSTEPSDGDLHGRLPPLPPEYSGRHLVSATYMDRRHGRHLGVPGYCRLVLLLCEYSTLMNSWSYDLSVFARTFAAPLLVC